jgi:hypothetical protein
MRFPSDKMSSAEQGGNNEAQQNGHSSSGDEQVGNNPPASNGVGGGGGNTNNSGGDGSPNARGNVGGGEPTDDFSDYLWMENEEEFDQEVRVLLINVF